VARVRDSLRRLNPVAPIHTAQQGDLDATVLFPPAFLDPAGATTARTVLYAEDVTDETDLAHTSRVAAVSLTAGRPLRWQNFDTWLRGIRLGHAEQLLRVKGMLDVVGMEGPVVVHGVHHVLHAPVALQRWPDADHRSRLVMIADAATGAAIRASWANALPGMTQ
jgi:G3E family GTPase